MPPGSKPKKRLKCLRARLVGRWRGYTAGQAVVLTVAGELWQREGDHWRLRQGTWTLDRVEAWAATAGYCRVSTGAAGEESWGRSINPVGLKALGKPPARDPDECYAPVPSAYAPYHAARIERYAARAAARLPLFAGGGA